LKGVPQMAIKDLPDYGEYTIHDLAGNFVFKVDRERLASDDIFSSQSCHEFTFVPDKMQSACVDIETSSTAKGVAWSLIEAKVLVNGQFNKEAWKSFSKAYPSVQARRHQDAVLESVKCNCVMYSMDTIYKAGKPQMLATRSGGYGSFNIYTLDGSHLFQVRRVEFRKGRIVGFNYTYYEFVNINNMNEVAYTNRGNDVRSLAAILMNNSIIAGGIFSQSAWDVYRKLNRTPESEVSVVDRGLDRVVDGKNKNGAGQPAKDVIIANGLIYSGGNEIAKFDSQTEQEGAKSYKMYQVYYPNGALFAVIKAPNFKGEKAKASLIKTGEEFYYESKSLEVIFEDLLARNLF
jgi:hypothetical protein